MSTPWSELPETELAGGERTRVSRAGDVVLRETGPWAPAVHALLRHLANEGFPGSPRVVSPGLDALGREILTYIPGDFVHPGPWCDAGLVAVGQMLRQLHEATRSFVPTAQAIWQPWFLREIEEGGQIIGHGDAAPWNTVTQGGLPVAWIDWEFAGPVHPLTELARVAWLFVQLHDDDVAARVGLPPLDTRARQLRLLTDAYGLAAPPRRQLFERMVEVAIREAANDAVELGVAPESHGPQWGMAWRTRAAAWMLRHRRTLENALA